MLELVLKSGVPIITCTTTDSVNAPDIIEHLSGKKVHRMEDFDCEQLAELDDDIEVVVIAPLGELTGTFEDLYATMVSLEKTLVFINTEYESPLFLNCGIIPVPEAMVVDILSEVVDESEVRPIMSTLGGMDLKTIGEVIRITATRDGEVTAKGVIQTRKLVASPITGLTQLETSMRYYVPDDHLEEWVVGNKPYILGDVDHRLRPRGLMFTGRQGCGKTQGSRYIADSIGLPLFLLDIAGLMTRWHGESETNLRNALQTVDQEAPCVVLMDEIEKVFASSEEGTTNRILGQMLWWLQERDSDVLVIMTSNDMSKIPPELYREGRVDKVIDFKGIQSEDIAVDFVTNMISTFDKIKKPTKKMITTAVHELWEESSNGVAHSTLSQLAIDLIKERNEV
ncbi:ATP-dependent zinc metalloprotease [Vibrio phage vB_VpS_PG28]|nr:ATP-dependent zinc metalloprotease [Vibrio phage vB_VpS_PG28]